MTSIEETSVFVTLPYQCLEYLHLHRLHKEF